MASSALSSAATGEAANIAVLLQAPPTDSMLTEPLARIAVKCGRKREDAQSADYTLAVYIEDLKQYPADIVLAVLWNWPACSKWWPDWVELHALLEELMKERRGVVEAARKVAGLPPLGYDGFVGGEAGVLVRTAARSLGIR